MSMLPYVVLVSSPSLVQPRFPVSTSHPSGKLHLFRAMNFRFHSDVFESSMCSYLSPWNLAWRWDTGGGGKWFGVQSQVGGLKWAKRDEAFFLRPVSYCTGQFWCSSECFFSPVARCLLLILLLCSSGQFFSSSMVLYFWKLACFF